MKRNKLLLLLALLLTAATGAWAQEPTTYSVKMKDGTVDAKNWSIASGEKSATGDAADGLTGLSEGDAVTLQYNGRLKVKGVKATSDAAPAAGKTVDLSTLTADYELKDGDVLTGTLAANVMITIADGATVTLDGLTINGTNNDSYKWAGLTPLGDATIILADGSTNTIKGFQERYPGILAAVGKTLTIKGTGSLTASSNGMGAGIGGSRDISCGNIEIQGGVITADGGTGSASIGGGYKASCGNITISGGTVTANGGLGGAGIGSGNQSSCVNITISGGSVTATGGQYAAGIGSGGSGSCVNITISGGTVTANGGDGSAGIGSGYGNSASCGTITIESSVTQVTATAGQSAPNSIGSCYGNVASCGTVTIGGTIYWDGSAYQNGGDTYLTTSPFTYPAPAAVSLIVNPVVGQIIGSDGKNYDANATLPTGVTAVAKIFYVGSDAETSTTYNHGLALALSDVGTQTWSSQTSSTCLTTQYSSSSAAKADMAGLANTDALVGHGSHTHNAASAARNYNSGTHPTGTSEWFLPSAGQWDKMATAAGGYGTLKTNAGLQGSATYWSSTEFNPGNAWDFYSLNGSWYNYSKGYADRVRACLAF